MQPTSITIPRLHIMPPAVKPGLPDAVVALLTEMHTHSASMAAMYQSDVAARPGTMGTYYADNRDKYLATATLIRTALADAGHDTYALAAAVAPIQAAITRAAWPHPMEAA